MSPLSTIQILASSFKPMNDFNIGEDPRLLELEFSTFWHDLGKLFEFLLVGFIGYLLINANINWLLNNRGA